MFRTFIYDSNNRLVVKGDSPITFAGDSNVITLQCIDSNLVVSGNVTVQSNLSIGPNSNSASASVVGLEVNTTDAVLLAKGTTNERPSQPIQGYVRYNTDTEQFEGYGAGDAWGSLGGVKSTNQETYVSAEEYPTSNDDNIRFINSNVESMRITRERLVGINTSTPTERLDVIDNIKASSNIYVMHRMGVATSNPAVGLEVNTTDAILLAKGTTNQRPTQPSKGHVRYNVDTDVFEGYGAGDAWGSLGGVKSTNQQTFVSAEEYPTSNDDNIRFVNSNIESMRITRDRFVGINTTTPTEYLEVVGNMKVSSNQYIMGQLGVNTSNPLVQLDVNGTIQATTYQGTTITELSNLGIFGSNTAIWASNTSYNASNAAVALSNYVYSTTTSTTATVADSSNIGAYGSNTAYWASNTAIPWASNTAIYGSNTSYWASNTAIPWASNVAIFGSNTTTWASNTAIPWASNTAVYGSNTADWASNTSIPWASNTAIYGSNTAYWASNSALPMVLTIASYGSNTSEWASNIASTDIPWASNVAVFGSNTATWASNTASTSASIDIPWASNTAIYGSNTSYWTSNTAIPWASNAAVYGSNTADWASNTAVYGSNTAYWASNTSIPWASNTAIYGSNTSYWASNTAIPWASNTAIYGSNTSDWASNAAIFASNTAMYGSNTADWASNMAANAASASSVPWASNTAIYGSNTADWASNTAIYGSNTSSWASNTAIYGSNTAAWTSNAAVYGSNATTWASNTAIPWASNAAVYGSNTSRWTSNTAIPWASNAAVYGSNTSYWASNTAIPWSSNAAVFGSNTSRWTSNTAIPWASNAAVYGSNTAVWGSNNLLKKTGDVFAGKLTMSNTSSPTQIQLGPLSSEVNIAFSNTSNGSAFMGLAFSNTNIHSLAASNDLIVRNDSGRLLLSYSSNSVGLLVNSSNNYVGINTMTPTEPLHVSGNAKVTGNLDITGAATFGSNFNVGGSFNLLGGGKYVVQGGVDGTQDRGIYMWNSNASEYALYMASAGASKSIAGTTAIAGANFSSNSIRLRTNASQSHGFIFENSSDQLLASIRGDGQAYFRSNIGINTSNIDETLTINGKLSTTTQVLGSSNTSTPSTPTFAFKENSNTGIYSACNNTIGFTSGGNVAATIESTNMTITSNLTIGSNIIADGNLTMRNRLIVNSLQVNRKSGTSANITATSVRGFSNASNGLVLSIGSNTPASNQALTVMWSNSEVFRVNGLGNVGLGTTTPLERIHVASSGKIYTDGQHLGTSNDSASLPSFSFRQMSNTGLFSPSNNAIGLSTNGTERLRIDSAGNVGIATTPTSTYKVDIATTSMRLQGGAGATPTTLYINPTNSANTTSTIQFTNTNNTITCTDTSNYGNLSNINTGPNMYYVSGGHNFAGNTYFASNVAIGTTPTSSYPLDVKGPTGQVGRFTDGTTSLVINPGKRFGANTAGWVTLDPTGSATSGVAIYDTLSVQGNATIGTSYSNVSTGPTNGLIVEGTLGIGLSNPNSTAYKLDVNGTINATNYSNVDYGMLNNKPSKTWLSYPLGLNVGSNGYFKLATIADPTVVQNGAHIEIRGFAGSWTNAPMSFHCLLKTRGGVVMTAQTQGTPQLANYDLVLYQEADSSYSLYFYSGDYYTHWNLQIGGEDQGATLLNPSGTVTTTPTGTLITRMSQNLQLVGSGSNVGIGTSNPIYRLDVNGDVNVTGNLLKNGASFSTSQWTSSSSNIYINGSNVAIGTSTPSVYTCDINGNLRVATGILMNANDNTYIGVNAASSAPSLGIIKKSSYAPSFAFTSNDGTSTVANAMYFSMLSGSNLAAVAACNLTTYMTLNAAGNLGIGTNYMSPGYKLDVSGKLRLAGDVTSQNSGPRLLINDFDGTQDGTMYGIAQITQNSAGTSTYSNQACLSFVRSGNWIASLGFAKGSNVFGIGQGQGPSTAFSPSYISVNSGGNVGIGTTNPSSKLEVNGDFNCVGTVKNNGSNIFQIDPAFSAYGNTNQVLSSGVSSKIAINTVEFDTHSSFNTTNNQYTAPLAGYYQVNGAISCASMTNNSGIFLVAIYKNGSEAKRGSRIPGNTVGVGAQVAAVIYLNANDTITLNCFHNNGASVTLENNAAFGALFSACRIRG